MAQGDSLQETIPKGAWTTMVVLTAASLVVVGWLATRGYRHVFEGAYVGPEACAQCHKKQFASWQTTRMAGAFEVLAPGKAAKAKRSAGLDPEADYRRVESCLTCHTTGYGQVGGFVSIETTPQMAGVTCEACHGPGGSYAGTVMSEENPTFKTSEAVEAGLIYPPTATVCVRCHNDDSPFVGMDYQFDFTASVRRGTHQHFQLKYDHE
jgi:cytochrome c553